jgi:D-alanyl-D-alanine dipeptidase
MKPSILAAVLMVLLAPSVHAQPFGGDPGFVSIVDADPTIVVDARYFGSHNFVGRPIAGYEANKCLLTPQAAEALVQVQEDLRPYGLGLKTFDCYRPQRAVDDFVAWAADADDTRMKVEFYPAVQKANLFRDGYIAERSGHSRGSTVDLTLVPLPIALREQGVQELADCRLQGDARSDPNSVAMGTAFDCFDPLSHTANPGISPEARSNRLLLKTLMERHGFANYEREWWHFTLSSEPFPDRYFDAPVR